MTEVIGGRFEIGAPLGQGDIGTVYRGLDQQTGQPVAIKLLKPELITPNRDTIDRFTREGEVLRRLNHPNIVKMLALITENNRSYVVMDYVGGGSLADWLAREGQLPIDTVMHIALGLADALTHAHHLNIIHGDLKPANVLLVEDGTARLTDFGIARLKRAAAPLTSGQTVETLLTPREQDILRLVTDGRSNKEIAQHLTVTPGTVKWYISEIYSKLGVHTRTQAIARARELSENKLAVGTSASVSLEAHEPDAHSDIWAFGLMLYEMLAGRKPLASESTAIVSGLSDAPPDLGLLISRMLEKDRDKRLSSMRQVSVALEGILQREMPASIGAIPESPKPEESHFATPTTGTREGLRPSPTRRRWMVLGGIIVILIIGLVALVASSALNRGNTAVQSAAAGDYIVLVAPFEAVRTEARDVGRFIADDLKQQLEVEAPFSKMRVLINPTMITTDDEARAAAEATGASVVVWGNYTADKVTTNVQVGSLEAFKYNQFDRATLERTANVRVEMTDENKQSVAPQVLGVLALLSFADGDQYGTGRAVAALDTIQVDEATFIGNGVAVRVHRYFQTPTADPSKAFDEINAALGDDSGNAILYALRSRARFRTLNVLINNSLPDSKILVEAERDAETARQLGQSRWVMPSILSYFSSFQGDVTLLNQIVEWRPDDWFAYFTRSAYYYDHGDFSHARVDIEQAMALKPDVNFPYVLATLIAWREGRLADAATYSTFALNNLPAEPDLLKRIFDALWGNSSNFAPMPPYNLFMFHYLLLGQYDDARQAFAFETRNYHDVSTSYTNGDTIVLFATAYCGLRDYSKAAQLYDIDLGSSDRDNMLAYLLHAQAQFQHGNRKSVQEDVAWVLHSSRADAFAPFAAAVMNGEFGCADLFDSQKIAEILQKYGTVKAADIAATLTAVPTIMPTETPDPKAAGDYIVLVAPFEAIRTEVRDVGRFIADDLKQQLEIEVPFSKMRVRINPNVISSDNEARAAAQATGASVVVWGNYTADKVTAYVQVGSLEAFKYNQFDRATLERTANVRVEMTDEIKQSVAPQVLGVLALLSFADGDQYGTGRAVAALDTIQVDEAAFVGSSVAVRVQRYFQLPTADSSKAFGEINAALGDDSGNAILYALRSQTHLRALDATGLSVPNSLDATHDAETAQQLGPKGWAMPSVLLSLTFNQPGMTYLNQIVERRPDDWFAYFTRSANYYDQGDFDHARTDIEQAMALKPDVNFPYMLAMFIAWREGRLADAAMYSNFALNYLPSTPDFLKRIFDALWGSAAIYAPLPPNNLLMFHYLILSQYDDARQAYDLENRTYLHGGAPAITNGDSIVLFGITYCNLGDYTRAGRLYDIDLSSTQDKYNMLAYLLRAQAEYNSGKRKLALLDMSIIQSSVQADALAPFAAAVMNGDFGCKDLFNSQKIAEILQKYGTVKSADISATLTAVPTATPAPTLEASATP